MSTEVASWLAQKAQALNWYEIVKIVGAAVAFLIGLWQYRKSQTWKRVEFVASEMKSFFEDDAAKSAMTMLDWRRKTMELYKYRGGNDPARVDVNYDIVSSSLGTHPDTHYNKVQSAVREIFDRFLSFLERFEGFIQTGVVEEKDFQPYLHYWTRLLSGNDAHSPEVTKKVLPQLWRYIHAYGYQNVIRFVGRYDEVRPEFRLQVAESDPRQPNAQ